MGSNGRRRGILAPPLRKHVRLDGLPDVLDDLPIAPAAGLGAGRARVAQLLDGSGKDQEGK